jgi:pantoate--beta-alanine ligase
VDVIATKVEWRRLLDDRRERGERVGFVPTMGALHAGHGALVEASMNDCDVTGVSIFVNPLQFGSKSDLEGYPRTLDDDASFLEAVGCDAVFAPSVEEMYPTFPEPPATTLHVGGAALGLEGADRPGHFDGMATVVALLFEITGPCRAYFGEKDFQQLAVVRQMVRDLSMPIDVVGCPTVREPDGLAMSSRNRRLHPKAREQARVVSQALAAGDAAVTQGAEVAAIEEAMLNCLSAVQEVAPFYATIVDVESLQRPSRLDDDGEYRLVIAVELDGVRLIDNCATRRGPSR